jgi:CheY-like chemotaxis protein
MGGDITVSSVPGEGSAFRVRLLLTADSSKTPLPGIETRITGYLGSRRKIMIVDDDPDHRMLMHDTLGPLGFTLFEASDGAQCLERLPQCAPDILLLDISMPGIDGWEVLRRFRARDPANAPVIMVSANGFETQQLRGQASRNCDFLVKPVVLPHLLELLQKHLALEWTFVPDAKPATPIERGRELPVARLKDAHLSELIALGNIGYVRGIESKLAALGRMAPETSLLLGELGEYVRTFQFKRYLNRLETLLQHED